MTDPREFGVASRDALIESLLDPAAYTHWVEEPVELHETHISWVLLAGKFAYKIKKPITTEFLDYGSLSKRHHACCEELRLGTRYVHGLYVDVVPITFEDGHVRMDGDTEPIEFAVRMMRFKDEALLEERLAMGAVTTDQMTQLANTIACFHDSEAKRSRSSSLGTAKILEYAEQNIDLLLTEPLLRHHPLIHELANWTTNQFESFHPHFVSRDLGGFIRECHGDLHCGNIVYWNDRWVPFDGIEFNSEYSWIDVISDVAFLVMDLEKRGYSELSAAFLNAYLEHTGDYQSLSVLRWYLVYRALVRAKVSVLRSRQEYQVQRLSISQMEPAMEYIRLGKRMVTPERRVLWITHGVSGSGKTTGSQRVVEREGAIRIRSDVERKRLFKTSKGNGATAAESSGMYSTTATSATYQRLYEVARGVLQAGFGVIVDATFLKAEDRLRFRRLAESEHADFRILDFQADKETLERRLTHRRLSGEDASDATLDILESQLQYQEPLTPEEQAWVIS
jgi:aminoglycoside phosphotransferase family enzyme/predicted kinase